jgi:hypothetical protein
MIFGPKGKLYIFNLGATAETSRIAPKPGGLNDNLWIVAFVLSGEAIDIDRYSRQRHRRKLA